MVACQGLKATRSALGRTEIVMLLSVVLRCIEHMQHMLVSSSMNINYPGLSAAYPIHDIPRSNLFNTSGLCQPLPPGSNAPIRFPCTVGNHG